MPMLTKLKTFAAASLMLSAAWVAHAGPVLWLSTGSPNQLATIDVATGATSVVGSTGVFLTDIAFNATGSLFGISFSGLYAVNKSNAATTLIGNLGSFSGTANALVFGSDGTLYMAGNTLYKLNTANGAATAIGSGIGYQSGGDLAFVGGRLYMASDSGALVDVDLTTGVGTAIGNLGAGNIFGLATPDNSTLYGMGDQNVYLINTATGAATLQSTFTPALGFAAGSAFLSEAGAPVSEPGSLALMGIALLGAVAVRRRARRAG